MTVEQLKSDIIRYLTDPAARGDIHGIYHEDAILEFPQSGQRLVGSRAIREAFPAEAVITVNRIRHGGNLLVVEARATYNGGPPVSSVAILELRDGQVAHETIYSG
jgi:hypothetical protein